MRKGKNKLKSVYSDSASNDKIAKKAIKKFGIKSQMEMLVEECSELILAVQKLKRAKNKSKVYKLEVAELSQRYNNFLEEMADVSIMILQFRLSDDKMNEQFIKHFNSKIQRLEKRINGK
jgi:NTP pyrophosphatase (non-canonical NTP hydrolase)